MLTLESLKAIFKNLGATEFLYKKLSDNDNSKNQIYLGGSYEALQVLPYGHINTDNGIKRPTFKAPLKMSWLSDDGKIIPAPNAKLILYPKYPEIRLSGFLSGCINAPSKYLQPKERSDRNGLHDGRILILCVIRDEIIAYLAPPCSIISNRLFGQLIDGVFGHEPIYEKDAKTELIQVLREVYRTNPHAMVRKYANGQIKPYEKMNAAGYTLEAQFGIIPNGNPEPDFMGWELKCHKDNTITLMTPQPDGGMYYQMGNRYFVEEYGHTTENGSRYFTGPYTCEPNIRFGKPRRLIVEGFDQANGKIIDTNGAIILIEEDSELASWSFSHILSHWNNKHNKACYVKYKQLHNYIDDRKKITFFPTVLLCEGTSAIKLIEGVIRNAVYYDPGSRVSPDGKQKPRSQFRVRADNLINLYNSAELIDLAL